MLLSSIIAALLLCILAASAITGEASGASSEPRVYASFFAPDSVNQLVNAETGQGWTALVGTWGVRRYQAYLSAPAGDGNCAAVLDAGIANARISVQLNDVSGGGTQGIVFRATDANNLLFTRGFGTSIQLFKKQAGALVQLGSFAGGIADGDLLTVELIGPKIVVRQNGVVRLNMTNGFNQSATRHGLYADNPAASFKHFTVERTSAEMLTDDWVRVLEPKPYQIFQRDAAGRASISVSGTFQGKPEAIEARWNGGGWRAMEINPSGGGFTGRLADLPAGQGTLEVRFANNPAVIWRQRYVGIGDVFLVAGQSNAEGRITAPQFYHHERLRAGVFDQLNRWREAYDPTDSSVTNQYSVWPLLATRVMKESGVPVGFITTSEGATGLVAMGGPWSRPGSNYSACVTSVRNSGAGGLKAVLWYQGETDANSPEMTVGPYREALKKLRRDLSKDLGFGRLKLVTAQLAYFHSAGSTETANSLNAVREAQGDPQDPDIFTGPILYDLNISEASGGDGQHIRTPAHARIEASRWWQALKSLLYGRPPARGPCVLFVRRVDPLHIDVAWSVTFLPLRLSNTSGAGWRVRDQSGLVRVVAATVQPNGNTVRLTLDRASLFAGRISWANYNEAVGIYLTDSAPEPLPAEPFINRVIP